MRKGKRLDAEFEGSVRQGALREAEHRDRQLCRAIASTALRRHGDVRRATSAFLARPFPRSSGLAPEILLVAAAQLLFMRVPPHAAVDLAVTHARQDVHARHFAGVINAVCRKLAAAPSPTKFEPADNTPPWLYDRWRKAYGDDRAAAIADAHRSEAPLDLTLRDDPRSFAASSGGDVFFGSTVRLTQWPDTVTDIPGYSEGRWWVQDAASALPVHLLGETKGARVLDLCAAPGGKTAQLALAGAEVTAVDRSEARLERLAANLRRLDLHARILAADMMTLPGEQNFDAVLLDAPCTATGTLRRHPDLPFHLDPADVARLASDQARMIRKAATFLRPGGTLVFSTCSLEAEEGEDHADALPETLVPVPLTKGEQGMHPQWINSRGQLKTTPDQGLDGFFAMRLRRV